MHSSEDSLVENDRHTNRDVDSLRGDEMELNAANPNGVDLLAGAPIRTVLSRSVCDCFRSFFQMTYLFSAEDLRVSGDAWSTGSTHHALSALVPENTRLASCLYFGGCFASFSICLLMLLLLMSLLVV